MTLATLAQQFGLLLWPASTALASGIQADSRLLQAGQIFAALKGTASDGIDHVPAAVAKGAVAVLCSAEGAARLSAGGQPPVPVLVATEPRAALARLAAAFHPAVPQVIGAVTGTNGKTSTATFLRQIWAGCGYSAASFGTTGITLPAGVTLDSGLAINHTTPDPVMLHRLLAGLGQAGIDHVAIEASSHGLAQFRLEGVKGLAAVGFTNLTRDHLDYHGSFENYAAAKLRLFTEVAPTGAAAVINAEDPLAPLFTGMAAARGLRVIRYGADAADLALLAARPMPSGLAVELRVFGQRLTIELPLVGRFQAMNALCALGMALGSGADQAKALAELPRLAGVPGRMQAAGHTAQGAGVYVDYAHTPDALTTALTALRPHVSGRLHVVFGAGGNRDSGKRPLMGRAAAAAADVVIVTDDNPRHEDPASIRAMVRAGCPMAQEIGDRGAAIAAAIAGLRAGDALLIAGKGHEAGQIVGDTVLPFDDLSVARALLSGGRA